MKAIQITQTGGPEVMSIREVPTPVPGPGEVWIRVAASGVNFIDLYIRDHVVELHVHLIQSLLHVLHVTRRHRHQTVPMAEDRTYATDRLFRPERSAQ